MTTERFHLVEKLFHEAAALDPEARKTFLDEACGGDDQLRSEVESLLDHADDIAESWKLQTGDPDSSLGTDQPTGEAVTKNMGDGEGTRLKGMEQPGDMIGRYKLLQKIGEGGFGVVYMAEQQEPVRRKVALKIIKLGMDTKQVVARLEAERQALAMMDHPNIARVLDAGA
ncbi:MAG TPA: serine/threonine protein kinase, partial [Phycisphaeraceae bacterium]|nr:serine/threonine protein kinase [Phycisphaeraceae bacterium]